MKERFGDAVVLRLLNITRYREMGMLWTLAFEQRYRGTTTTVHLTTVEIDGLTPSSLVDVMKSWPDCILLPLTVPRYMSLRLAEIVHVLGLPTRIIAVSGTLAPAPVVMRLFDEFLHIPVGPEVVMQTLESVCGREVDRLRDAAAIEDALLSLVQAANCFSRMNGSLADYRSVWAPVPPENVGMEFCLTPLVN